MGVQRLDCLCYTRPTNTPLIAAMETLLNISALHVLIKGEIRSVAHRQEPIIRGHGEKQLKLNKEIKEHNVLVIPFDYFTATYHFYKNFKTNIPRDDHQQV